MNTSRPIASGCLAAGLILAGTVALADPAGQNEDPQQVPEHFRGLAASGLAIAEDPALQQAEAQLGLAQQAWQENLWCALLRKDQAPAVRLLTLGALEQIGQWTPDRAAAPCEDGDPADQAESIVRDALADGWNDPGVLFRVYGRWCNDPLAAGVCDRPAIESQLRTLAPDNAAALLAPLMLTAPDDPDALPLAERRRLLAKAARAPYFDLRQGDGVYDAYLAIQAYRAHAPYPTGSEELQIALESAVPSLQRVWDMGPASPLVVSTLVEAVWHPGLMPHCLERIKAKDREAMDACRAIADLMLAAPSETVNFTQGPAIDRMLRRFEMTGEPNPKPDPLVWERSLRAVVNVCQQPMELTFGFNLDPRLPEDHYARFLQVFQAKGHRPAMIEAAQREWPFHPERHYIDPADCPKIMQLDVATREDLYQLYESDPKAFKLAVVEIFGPPWRPSAVSP